MEVPALVTPEPGVGRGVSSRRRLASRNLLRSAQIGFALFVVVMVVSGLWGVTRQQSSPVSQEVAGFRLQQVVEGQAALDMVRRLHLGSPQLEAAWVASYEGDAIVWQGAMSSAAEARQQLEAMAQAIRSAATPFSPPVEIEMEGRQMFTVTDSSRRHYFFQSGSRVVWVTPPRGSEEPFIRGVLKWF